ncbi:peptidase family M49-domain-containing protein [Cladochytrium replicatum]|nr:peptidase family M49-domain-containing protein [Cladochytrium replicatum]
MPEASVPEHLLAPSAIRVVRLEIGDAFNRLEPTVKRYAHHLSRAAWRGSRLTMSQAFHLGLDLLACMEDIFKAFLVQTESEETTIFSVGNLKGRKLDLDVLQKHADLTDQEMKDFMIWVGNFLGYFTIFNVFGGNRWIPRIPRDRFDAVVQAAQDAAGTDADIVNRWSNLGDFIYDTERSTRVGMPGDNSPTNYAAGIYIGDVTEEEGMLLQRFIGDALKVREEWVENTVVQKHADGTLEIKRCSVEGVGDAPLEYEFEGRRILISKGHLSEHLSSVVEELQLAIPYAGNERQKKVLELYIKQFTSGDRIMEIDREWVLDMDPPVDYYIGFGSPYADPLGGIRQEFTSEVSVQDPKQSQLYEGIVSAATERLDGSGSDDARIKVDHLPWGPAFEKEKYTRPSFKASALLTRMRGFPIGIAYGAADDEGNVIGMKQFNFENMSIRIEPNEPLLHAEDAKLLSDVYQDAMDINTALHELVGHGSGRDFREILDENRNSVFNFDVNTIDPTTGEKITSWYKPGQDYKTVFGPLGVTFEEARAEMVALYAVFNSAYLSVFGYPGVTTKEGREFVRLVVLNIIIQGVRALSAHTTSKGWGQAHMQMYHFILRLLVEKGGASVTLPTDEDPVPKVSVVSSDKIVETVKPAIEEALLLIQVCRSTADPERGRALYEKYTTVDEHWEQIKQGYLKVANPRNVYVQTNTFLTGSGEVVIRQYDRSPAGIVESWLDRVY